MTQMKTLNTSQRVTLRELYLGYEFKYRDIESSTVPIPYFPKSEITETKYSLTFKQWKKIILIYFKHIVMYLITTGSRFKIPSRLGIFQMKKYRTKNSPDWAKTRVVYGTTRVKPIMFKNTHTQGYKPIIVWLRQGQNGKFKYKWYWRFTLTKKSWKKVSDTIFNKLTTINKLQEA